MSEKLTRITLPGTPSVGFADWGEKSPKEMIAILRKHGRHLMDEATAIEDAEDHEFQIDVVRGPIVQHHVKTLQEAGPKYCRTCGVYPADYPSDTCAGCDAYSGHQS